MKTRTYTLIDKLHTSVLSEQAHADHGQGVPAKLVQLVRDATKQFVDVNSATAAGYQPFLGCVSGPDHGAMGNHYVNGALVGDCVPKPRRSGGETIK